MVRMVRISCGTRVVFTVRMRLGTHMVRMVRIWYASGAHLVRTEYHVHAYHAYQKWYAWYASERTEQFADALVQGQCIWFNTDLTPSGDKTVLELQNLVFLS